MPKLWSTLKGITVFTVAASLIACQDKPAATDAAGSNAGNSAKMEDTVTYNLFFNRGEPNYPQDGGEGRKMMLDGLKKAGITGADFKVTLASGDEYFTKLNLMATSGTLPDYFNVNLATLTKFADEGLILPLNDLLPKMPHASKMFRPQDLDAGTIDGKIYGLPNAFRPEPINGPAGGYVIRKDWLDNVGLPMPSTLDEFHEVLKAFTTKDPDRNGKNDTYGLGGMKPENTGTAAGFEGIFGAFGVHPSYWLERQGSLKQGMVLPETKQALAVLQQWYKEGIIDPDFVTATSKQLNEKVINSKIGVWNGSVWPLDPGNSVYRSLKQTVPGMSLQMVPPQTGPNGAKGWPAGGAGGTFYVISAKAKNPELLARMLDWTASDDPDGGHMLITYGVEGKDYTFDKQKNLITQTSSADDLTMIGLSNPVQFINVVDRRWASEPILKGLEVTGQNTFMDQFSKAVPAQQEYPDINKLWIEYFVKIVTGALPVDKWDEFVQKYYQQGGKKIEEQVNAEWKKSKK
ncbi:extracellular solute-binding protein [Paenibacillus filicis]|uniref:Extracellular solute-binding protein n=1 Tax=Paenibacillus gyeongsangnamensis TaxID=3388067 RepID=A0ABT4Q4K7_9BACL|nr:extracellular solute-binding protein [Paenibacillus filicis]MCZ8511717.1 extracellular solute-binding protein [Paenibacillus filicis]